MSDEQLSRALAHWSAPEPPPGLAAGVWARVDERRPSILENAWAFRLAALLTTVLWLVVVVAPMRQPAPRTAESLTAALAMAGVER